MAAAGTWWAETLNPLGLSQGDILSPIPLGPTKYPPIFMGRDVFTKPGTSKNYWPERAEIELFKKDNTGLFIARGRLSHSIVVSHSCEVENKPDIDRALVAPIAPLDRISDPASRARVINQERRAFLPLPAIPGLGDYYADLRVITAVDIEFVRAANREASMSDDGLIRLKAQLIEFFTRIPRQELEDLIRKSI